MTPISNQSGGAGGHLLRLRGKLDDEGRAFPLLALDLDRAVVGFHDLLHDVETESETRRLVHGRRPREPLEDPAPVFRRNAEPLVPDEEADGVFQGLDGQTHGPGVAILDGVREEIGDDLVDSESVPDAEDRAQASITISEPV